MVTLFADQNQRFIAAFKNSILVDVKELKLAQPSTYQLSWQFWFQAYQQIDQLCGEFASDQHKNFLWTVPIVESQMKTKTIMSLDNNSKHILIKYQLIHLANYLTEENAFVLFMHIVLILYCILDHKTTKSVIADICKQQSASQ